MVIALTRFQNWSVEEFNVGIFMWINIREILLKIPKCYLNCQTILFLKVVKKYPHFSFKKKLPPQILGIVTIPHSPTHLFVHLSSSIHLSLSPIISLSLSLTFTLARARAHSQYHSRFVSFSFLLTLALNLVLILFHRLLLQHGTGIPLVIFFF